MAKQIDILKKIKVKNNLLRGLNAKQALIEAGYSPATAEHSTGMTVVKRSQAEIIEEMKASDVTVDLVIEHLHEDRELARQRGDIATMKGVDELLGKYLSMWTEKRVIDATVMTQTEQNIISKYIDSNRISNNL